MAFRITTRYHNITGEAPRASASHVRVPQLQEVVQHLVEPLALLRVLERGRYRRHVHFEDGFVLEEFVEEPHHLDVTLDPEEARVREDVVVHAESLRGPGFEGLVAAGDLDGAHVLRVPRAEVVRELRGGDVGDSPGAEAFFHLAVDGFSVDEHLQSE